MKWDLTDDQKALVKLMYKWRMAVISAEEFATIITDAGYRREQTAPEPATSGETGLRRPKG